MLKEVRWQPKQNEHTTAKHCTHKHAQIHCMNLQGLGEGEEKDIQRRWGEGKRSEGEVGGMQRADVKIG